jgi:hypothetical protein
MEQGHMSGTTLPTLGRCDHAGACPDDRAPFVAAQRFPGHRQPDPRNQSGRREQEIWLSRAHVQVTLKVDAHRPDALHEQQRL